MTKKYIANSKGDLTGCRNLTIDNAPTIPKDKAIFPEIMDEITYVIIGNIHRVAVWVKVTTQRWPINNSISRIEKEATNNEKIIMILSDWPIKIFNIN